MIKISEAIAIVERECNALVAEPCDIDESVGRILAADIVADMDLPPFNRSQMDGFAVRASDTSDPPARLSIIGESVAGIGFDGRVERREAVRIMTGARLPDGADAVQKVEDTREADGFVEILEAVKPGLNINRRATEIVAGDVVFTKGERVTDQMIAALASFGVARPLVSAKPRVGILSTGSEIVGVEETPARDQIRNSNSTMLKVLASRAGADATIFPHVHDELENLKASIASIVESEEPDVLIITGGVSVGDYDFTKPALRELGAEIFFEKVSLKPGKPTVFARLGGTLVFGLPGNPVSVAVTFYLFVRHALMNMQSAKICSLASGTAVCASRIRGAAERDCFLPVSTSTVADGSLTIETLRFSGSSNFIAFARANALVFVPQGRDLVAGEIAEILFL